MPTRKPPSYERAGSAEVNAMIERVAPDILELLGDGVPRTKPAIVEALAGRHDKQDVVHALIRLRYRPGGGDGWQVHAGCGRAVTGSPEANGRETPRPSACGPR
jgi:hypothetical protein